MDEPVERERSIDGVPSYMLARARALGNVTPAEIAEFILNNADQDDGWWQVEAAIKTTSPQPQTSSSSGAASPPAEHVQGVAATLSNVLPLPLATPMPRHLARAAVRSASAPVGWNHNSGGNSLSANNTERTFVNQHPHEQTGESDSHAAPGTPFVYQDPVLYGAVARKLKTIAETDEAEYLEALAEAEAEAAEFEAAAAAAAPAAEATTTATKAAARSAFMEKATAKLTKELGRAPYTPELLQACAYTRDDHIKTITKMDMLLSKQLAKGDLVEVNISEHSLAMQSMHWHHRMDPLASVLEQQVHNGGDGKRIKCKQCHLIISSISSVTAAPGLVLPGATVQIQSYCNLQLNGKVGVAVSFDANTHRWAVRVEGSTQTVMLDSKQLNVVPLNPGASASANASGGASGGGGAKSALADAPPDVGETLVCRRCLLCDACSKIHRCTHENGSACDRFSQAQEQSLSILLKESTTATAMSASPSLSPPSPSSSSAAAENSAIWLPAVVLHVKNGICKRDNTDGGYGGGTTLTPPSHPVEIQLRLRPQDSAEPVRLPFKMRPGSFSRPYFRRKSRGRRNQSRNRNRNRNRNQNAENDDSDLSEEDEDNNSEDGDGGGADTHHHDGGADGDVDAELNDAPTGSKAGQRRMQRKQISTHAEVTCWFNINKCIRRTPERQLPWVAQLEPGDAVAVKTRMKTVLIHNETGDVLPWNFVDGNRRYENSRSNSSDWMLGTVEKKFEWLAPNRFAVSASIQCGAGIDRGRCLDREILERVSSRTQFKTVLVLYNFEHRQEDQNVTATGVRSDHECSNRGGGGGRGGGAAETKGTPMSTRTHPCPPTDTVVITHALIEQACRTVFNGLDSGERNNASCTIQSFDGNGDLIPDSSSSSSSSHQQQTQPAFVTVHVQSNDWQGNFEATAMFAALQSHVTNGSKTNPFFDSNHGCMIEYTIDWAHHFRVSSVAEKPHELPMPSYKSGSSDDSRSSDNHALMDRNARADGPLFVWKTDNSSSSNTNATSSTTVESAASYMWEGSAKVLAALPFSSGLLHDQQCRTMQAIGLDNPSALVGHYIHKSNSDSDSDTNDDDWFVNSYIQHARQHVICARQGQNRNEGFMAEVVSLTDGTKENNVNFTLEPSIMKMVPSHHVAPAHRHFRECGSCMDFVPMSQFAKFCFRIFKVTGDGKTIEGERHPLEICNTCFKQHCTTSITGENAGKLYVKCPVHGCERSLQTLELKSIVDPDTYDGLITRIKEMEQQSVGGVEGSDMTAAEFAAMGIELRLCPACFCRIEKNRGCSTMACYRCGKSFEWSTAQLLGTLSSTATSASAAATATAEQLHDAASWITDTSNAVAAGARGLGRLQPIVSSICLMTLDIMDICYAAISSARNTAFDNIEAPPVVVQFCTVFAGKVLLAALITFTLSVFSQFASLVIQCASQLVTTAGTAILGGPTAWLCEMYSNFDMLIAPSNEIASIAAAVVPPLIVFGWLQQLKEDPMRPGVCMTPFVLGFNVLLAFANSPLRIMQSAMMALVPLWVCLLIDDKDTALKPGLTGIIVFVAATGAILISPFGTWVNCICWTMLVQLAVSMLLSMHNAALRSRARTMLAMIKDEEIHYVILGIGTIVVVIKAVIFGPPFSMDINSSNSSLSSAMANASITNVSSAKGADENHDGQLLTMLLRRVAIFYFALFKSKAAIFGRCYNVEDYFTSLNTLVDEKLESLPKLLVGMVAVHLVTLVVSFLLDDDRLGNTVKSLCILSVSCGLTMFATIAVKYDVPRASKWWRRKLNVFLFRTCLAVALWTVMTGMFGTSYAEQGGFASGQSVKLQGLKARPELNGEVGLALRFNTINGRWTVRLRNGDGKKVKPVNLEPVGGRHGRVYVFWGDAQWSRAQLLGEIARGSWGLCRASVADVTVPATERWANLNGRIAFAPVSDMSEDYIKDVPLTLHHTAPHCTILYDVITKSRT